MKPLFTLGFTKISAESFFQSLRTARVRRLIDVRLHSQSQLAGFAKERDLPYFLSALCGITYEHALDLAPTENLLHAYRSGRLDWDGYARRFRRLLRERHVEKNHSPAELTGACLLCSEPTPEHCHRRLVAEYFHDFFPKLEIVHLPLASSL